MVILRERSESQDLRTFDKATLMHTEDEMCLHKKQTIAE